MWRVALGGLKTGDIIRKYKIPGAKVNYVFCGGRVLETVEHLVVDCKALDTIREISIEYYSLFELKVLNSDCDAMRLLLTLGLTPMVESKHKSLNIFDFTSEYCYTIWRNDIIFNYKVLNPDSISEMAQILKSKCKILYSDNLKNSRAGEVVGE